MKNLDYNERAHRCHMELEKILDNAKVGKYEHLGYEEKREMLEDVKKKWKVGGYQ